jgi:GGDEF domain-containing protein
MGEIVKGLYSVHWRRQLQKYGSIRRPSTELDAEPHSLNCHPIVVLSLGLFLVFSHTLVAVLHPAHRGSILYALMGLAILLCAAIAFVHGRATIGAASLRWCLFAGALCISGVNLIRAGIDAFLTSPLSTVGSIMQAVAGTLIILALTLPFTNRNVAERSLDVVTALLFCVFRIVYLRMQVSLHVSPGNTFTRFTFESALAVLLASVALIAASGAESSFFRCALAYLISGLIGGFFTNQIGAEWFHQATWSLASTLLHVVVAVYCLHRLSAPYPVADFRSHKVVLRSLVPFVMSCLLVWLSVLLLPTYRYLGDIGITLGVVGLLARIGLTACRREYERTTINSLLSAPATPAAHSPLIGVESQVGFRLALARARNTVTPKNPTVLLLFCVQDASPSESVLLYEQEDDHLIVTARYLSEWKVSGSTLSYLGSARFALLLPETSFDMGNVLANQMRSSLEGLRLSDPANRITVSSGVAAARHSAEVNDLLGLATESLVRSLMGRGERSTPLSFSPDLNFDC